MYAGGRIQWTTGDISGGLDGLGGTEALAGINAGDGINHFTVSGSLTPSIINITRTSNVGIPGVWMFWIGNRTYIYAYKCRILCFKVRPLSPLNLCIILFSNSHNIDYYTHRFNLYSQSSYN